MHQLLTSINRGIYVISRDPFGEKVPAILAGPLRKEKKLKNWETLTVIGLGSQGQAWAQNLKDSGYKVQCYLRENSPSHSRAQELGLNIVKDFQNTDALLLLIPDHQHNHFLKDNADSLPDGMPIILAHGASIMEHSWQDNYPQLVPLLLAPKAIASEIRYQFLNKGKLGAVYSVEYTKPESSEKYRHHLLTLAGALGITAGPFEASFEQEAKADLFSEQSLLCGLIPYAALQSFNTLREQGIPQELAFLECWHEVKLIADTMIKSGPAGLFELISPHALAGSEDARQHFFDKEYHTAVEKVRQNIWSSQFLRDCSKRDLDKLRQDVVGRWKNSEIQEVFERLKKDLVNES